VWSVPRCYKRAQKTGRSSVRSSRSRVVCSRRRRVEVQDASLPGYELGSKGTEWSRVFGIGSRRIRARKGIRWCKGDFICELKLSDTDKSVARLRLVKTENRSACRTVNGKVCRIAIALYYL
jgi:hypothetical protein